MVLYGNNVSQNPCSILCLCPSYISQLVQPVSSLYWYQGLWSSSSARYVVQRTRTKFAEELSLSPVHLCGTLYLQISNKRLTLLFLNTNSEVICSALLLLMWLC